MSSTSRPSCPDGGELVAALGKVTRIAAGALLSGASLVAAVLVGEEAPSAACCAGGVTTGGAARVARVGLLV